jgi:hypothetical protein
MRLCRVGGVERRRFENLLGDIADRRTAQYIVL